MSVVTPGRIPQVDSWPSASQDDFRAGPSYESFTQPKPQNLPVQRSPTSRPSKLKSLRPWSFNFGQSTSSNGQSSKTSQESTPSPSDLRQPYDELRIIVEPTGLSGHLDGAPSRRPGISDSSRWSSEDDATPDSYSWVDPNDGIDHLRATPATIQRRKSSQSEPHSRVGVASRSILEASRQLLHVPSSPTTQASRSKIDPEESYKSLLAYQASFSPKPLASSVATAHGSIHGSSQEWHDLVDEGFRESLGNKEVKRQGLWWELIKSEAEYVRDLRIVCQGFIHPLEAHDPPLLVPDTRLVALVSEVFSTIPEILQAHEKLLSRLMDRQREQWPLLDTATDVLLKTIIEVHDLYETYMKNFPFAEARVRRESERNKGFQEFLAGRNSNELTQRRDIFVFLSRPVTRLPRMLLLLDAILKATPKDHPDQEYIPTVISILTGTLRASQPGIESAEAKIKYWNVAEKLMFKKGEVIDLDVGEQKRTLVHSGFVFRRVRSESNWHGWQDLHAFLFDNYFILTKNEENGKYIAVTRPIHIDFLNIGPIDSVPERRYDYINQARRKARSDATDTYHPDRLMYPFTISTSSGPNGKILTLCVSSQAAREQWKEKIDGAKALRSFDVENNRMFAIHTIDVPAEVATPFFTADAFKWLGREAIVVAGPRSVWMGWRQDQESFREIIHLSSGAISAVVSLPDFGWLLVTVDGCLIAYNLQVLVPTHEPLTWISLSRSDGVELSDPNQQVVFVRIGTTKGRLLVAHASYVVENHETCLTFEEPLHLTSTAAGVDKFGFRRFAQVNLPGFASDISFFRKTIAAIMEKNVVIAEAGNPSFNVVPVFPQPNPFKDTVGRLITQSKPLGMYQSQENEFTLAFEWGACFVTKYGEISRDGSYLRWNFSPSNIVFRAPHLLLFDEANGRVEVREVATGKMCEVLEWKGIKPVLGPKVDERVLALSPSCLIEVVETVPLA